MSVKLWLDDERDPRTYAGKDLAGSVLHRYGTDWTWVKDIEDAKPVLAAGGVDVLSCDNDLGTGHTEGWRLLEWLEREVASDPDFPVPHRIHAHTSNPVARDKMAATIESIGRLASRKGRFA